MSWSWSYVHIVSPSHRWWWWWVGRISTVVRNYRNILSGTAHLRWRGRNGNCSRIVIAKSPIKGWKLNVCVRNPNHYPHYHLPISLYALRHARPALILNARLVKSAHPSATWGRLQLWIPPTRPIISQRTTLLQLLDPTNLFFFICIFLYPLKDSLIHPCCSLVWALEVCCHLFFNVFYIYFIYIYIFIQSTNRPMDAMTVLEMLSWVAVLNVSLLWQMVSERIFAVADPCFPVPETEGRCVIMSFGVELLASPWGRCRWVCRLWAWRRTDAPNTWVR